MADFAAVISRKENHTCLTVASSKIERFRLERASRFVSLLA